MSTIGDALKAARLAKQQAGGSAAINKVSPSFQQNIKPPSTSPITASSPVAPSVKSIPVSTPSIKVVTMLTQISKPPTISIPPSSSTIAIASPVSPSSSSGLGDALKAARLTRQQQQQGGGGGGSGVVTSPSTKENIPPTLSIPVPSPSPSSPPSSIKKPIIVPMPPSSSPSSYQPIKPVILPPPKSNISSSPKVVASPQIIPVTVAPIIESVPSAAETKSSSSTNIPTTTPSTKKTWQVPSSSSSSSKPSSSSNSHTPVSYIPIKSTAVLKQGSAYVPSSSKKITDLPATTIPLSPTSVTQTFTSVTKAETATETITTFTNILKSTQLPPVTTTFNKNSNKTTTTAGSSSYKATIEKPADFSWKRDNIAKMFGAATSNATTGGNTVTQTSTLTVTEKKPNASAVVIEKSEDFSKKKADIAKFFGAAGNNNNNSDKHDDSSFMQTSSLTFTETKPAKVVIERSENFSKNKENIAKMFGGGSNSGISKPSPPTVTTVTEVSESIIKTPTTFTSSSSTTYTENDNNNNNNNNNNNTSSTATSDDFSKKRENIAKLFGGGSGNTSNNVSPRIPEPTSATYKSSLPSQQPNSDFAMKKEEMAKFFAAAGGSGSTNNNISTQPSPPPPRAIGKITPPATLNLQFLGGGSGNTKPSTSSSSDTATSSNNSSGDSSSFKFNKFSMMQKLKIPEPAIKQKMVSDGLSQADIDFFLSGAFNNYDDTTNSNSSNSNTASGSGGYVMSESMMKYEKMRKMRIPDAAIRQKMMSEGVSASEIESFLASQSAADTPATVAANKPSPPPPPSVSSTSGGSNSDDIVDETGLFEKYVKMKKMRLPDGAIRQKMMSDGMNSADTTLFFDSLANGNVIARSASTIKTAVSTVKATVTTTTAASSSDEIVDETGLFEKYIKMKKMRLPDGAIRQKMMSDGINSVDTTLFFDCLAKGNVIKRVGSSSTTPTTPAIPAPVPVVPTPAVPELYVDDAAEARKAMFKMKTFELVAPPKINLMSTTAAAPVVDVAAQLRKAREVTAETTAVAAETKAITSPKVESVVNKWNDEANKEAIQNMFKTAPFLLTPPPKIALPPVEKPKIDLGEQLRQMRLARILKESTAVAVAAGIDFPATTTTTTTSPTTVAEEASITAASVTSPATAAPEPPPVIKRKLKKRSIIGAPTLNALKFRSLLDEMALLLQAETDIKEVVDVAARDMTRDTDTVLIGGGGGENNKKTAGAAGGGVLVSVTDDPKLATYKKMRKMNMPELAIRQKMIFDGITTEVIEALMKAPVERPVAVNNEDADLQSGYRSAGGGGGGNNISFVYSEIYHFVENPIRTATFKNEISVVAYERNQNMSHIKDATDAVNAMASIRSSIMKRLSIIQLAQLDAQQQHQLKLARLAQQAQSQRRHMNKLSKGYFVGKALGKSTVLNNRNIKFQTAFHITPLSRLSESTMNSNSSSVMSKPTYLYDKQTNALLPSESTRFQHEDWTTSVESSRSNDGTNNDNDGGVTSGRSISSESSAGRTSLSNFFKGIIGSPRINATNNNNSPRASASIQQQQYQRQQQQERLSMSHNTGTTAGASSYKTNNTELTSRESSSKASTNNNNNIVISPRPPMLSNGNNTNNNSDRVTSGLFPTSARLSASQHHPVRPLLLNNNTGGSSNKNDSNNSIMRYSRASSLSLDYDIGVVQDMKQQNQQQPRNNAVQYKLREESITQPLSSSRYQQQQQSIETKPPKRKSIFMTLFGQIKEAPPPSTPSFKRQ